jgi:hypothetical protein
MHRPWRLAHAAVLLLLFLLPMMILLGTAERTDRGPTVMFWLTLMLPLLILRWLWRRADPDEGSEAQVTAARRVASRTGASEEFAALGARRRRTAHVRRRWHSHGRRPPS